ERRDAPAVAIRVELPIGQSRGSDLEFQTRPPRYPRHVCRVARPDYSVLGQSRCKLKTETTARGSTSISGSPVASHASRTTVLISQNFGAVLALEFRERVTFGQTS